MDKHRIIEEIKRTASENAGQALGQARFQTETGISVGAWRGKYWRTWSEALAEAGFPPNPPLEAHSAESLTLAMIRLARRNRAFPTQAELMLEKRQDPSFPNKEAFSKLGSKSARIQLVRAYAAQHKEYDDVLEYLPLVEAADDGVTSETTEDLVDGSVYMVKLGKHYKIGRTSSVPRRHSEIALELPEKPISVHVIRTDDAVGIEAYWHKRFASKRTNGEWFALTSADVRAFKRRKFM